MLTRHGLPGCCRKVEFKLVIQDENGVEWQPGENIILEIPEASSEIIVEADWSDPSKVTVLEHTASPAVPPTGDDVSLAAQPPHGGARRVHQSYEEDLINNTIGADASALVNNDNGTDLKGVHCMYDESQLKGKKVVELRAVAKELGLPTSGKKAELIERIVSSSG